ncbi:hypothetical protein WJX72_001956 [[Myrmecia] bisecta]|uniref:Uncharacterized protein n=1 Tax=[Myrmecia] bisecta TaxID=41462 RepID=A0AAW1QEB4_9CHLO
MASLVSAHAFANHKGGCGKSTLVFHTSAAYAEAHPKQNVLVVDMTLGGSRRADVGGANLVKLLAKNLSNAALLKAAAVDPNPKPEPVYVNAPPLKMLSGPEVADITADGATTPANGGTPFGNFFLRALTFARQNSWMSNGDEPGIPASPPAPQPLTTPPTELADLRKDVTSRQQGTCARVQMVIWNKVGMAKTKPCPGVSNLFTPSKGDLAVIKDLNVGLAELARNLPAVFVHDVSDSEDARDFVTSSTMCMQQFGTSGIAALDHGVPYSAMRPGQLPGGQTGYTIDKKQLGRCQANISSLVAVLNTNGPAAVHTGMPTKSRRFM